MMMKAGSHDKLSLKFHANDSTESAVNSKISFSQHIEVIIFTRAVTLARIYDRHYVTGY